MSYAPDLFGCNVFNDAAMQEYLPPETCAALEKTVRDNTPLDPALADAVAEGMKQWAIKKGATHYCHWFQPMTGTTAEKHDSFVSPTGDGEKIMEFSAKELIMGEPDASSFPNGGLRSTFEARGYTAWDPTSYAFIRDHTLCIPTVFCSYGGQVLDKKTPLLRSAEALNRQALRVLRALGITTVSRVIATVGAEQEYFLIDLDKYASREDLFLCGRTLFGAKPPKGQELNDHYFGTLKPRVSEFMEDLNAELWKLGIPAKTEHNEAAPAQHELAPVFEPVNLATDHNQLTMAVMKKLAPRHGFACLLHEKPFAGVNGSGKHNNWSLATDEGENLFKPGKHPETNTRFLVFLAAMIAAVDEHQDLLRLSAASASNDCRLGGNEAPPAIVSVYLGDGLCEILGQIERGEPGVRKKTKVEVGVDALTQVVRNTSDRNRTSPMAFTGNKFEFRMLGSSASIAGTNTMLNTMVADVLCSFADELEAAEDTDAAVQSLLRRTIRKHKRILFNGDNYSAEWVKEAERRGLLNLPSANLAIPRLTDEKNIALFEKHKVYTRQELVSRREILLNEYAKCVNIEARTLSEMVRRKLLPSILSYTDRLAGAVLRKRQLDLPTAPEEPLLRKLSGFAAQLSEEVAQLDLSLETVRNAGDSQAVANAYRNEIVSRMGTIRAILDAAEEDIDAQVWAYPTYTDILFYCD